MKDHLTPEQISIMAEEKVVTDSSLANKRAINALFRAQDDSNLYPISGKFNVTERAIQKVRKFEKESGGCIQGLEYALFLDSEISKMVNSEN